MILVSLFNLALFYLSGILACRVTLVRTNADNSEAYFALTPDKDLFKPRTCTWDGAFEAMVDHIRGDFMVFEMPLEHNPNLLIILDEALFSRRGPLTWIPINEESASQRMSDDAYAAFLGLNDQKMSNKLVIGQFKRLTHWNPPNFAPRPLSNHQGGIKNLGSTCYMNASLQALWNTSLFHDIFQKHYPKHADNPLVSSLNVIFQSMESGQLAKEEEIEDFIKAVEPYTIIPDMMQQNDPQEFIDGLLDGLAQAFRSTPLLPNSVIDSLFYMEQEDIVNCLCGLHYERRNPTTFIKADLRSNDPDLIELGDLLDRLAKVDRIVDNPAHPAPGHDLTNQISIHNVSPILILQISRKGGMEQRGHDFVFPKLNQMVFFPTE